MSDPDLTPSAAQNRAAWDARADAYQHKHGGQLDAAGGTAWGVWQLPESELRILGDVAGHDVLELGCGAAQWGIALAQRGARMTGLDNSARQLEHARRKMAAAGVDFPLVHASAEAVPLPDAGFDLVFCDYGAMSFGDPYRTVPECARLLRPGGRLAFSTSSAVLELAWPADLEHPTERLTRDYWDLRTTESEGTVDYNLPYGAWIRLFRANGLQVEDLVELCPPPSATSTYRDAIDLAWARRWPMENVWVLRREG